MCSKSNVPSRNSTSIIPRTACCCAKCPTGTAMTITAICFRRNCRRRSAISSPGNTEVDIIFAGKALEVCFGTGDAWLWTKTELRLSEIPDVVRRALQSSQYGTWEIDDADLYESPDRVWYAFDMEDPRSEREATVCILGDGTLL